MKPTDFEPSPWKIVVDENVLQGNPMLIADNASVITTLSHPKQFEGCKNWTPENQMATIALLSATPELYEALIEVCEELLKFKNNAIANGYNPKSIPIKAAERAVDTARAAIAKARNVNLIKKECYK